MLLVEFSITPLDKGESVSQYVAHSLDIVDRSGLDYQLTAMGTLIEGEWDQVFSVIKACHQRMQEDCHRISTLIKIDYREKGKGRLSSKVESVEEKLGRPLRK